MQLGLGGDGDAEGRLVEQERAAAQVEPLGEDHLLLAEVDLAQCGESPARKLFWRDRRPELYGEWLRG